MRKLKYKISVVSSVVLLIGAVGCTDLEDKVLDRPTDLSTGTGSSNAVGLLNAAYAQLNSFTDQAGVYALQEHPSDEMMGPTRGTDWDDFGTWRRLHQHTWDAAHNQVNDSWDRLNTGIFRSTEALAAAGNDASIAAQAQFLRAFFMFHVVDLFGQVPLREANASFDDIPRGSGGCPCGFTGYGSKC
jgi:starch-binding outer membrane protein, SusD/RagB family